jgi:[protein-PII] uridylyltransferase
VYLLEPNIKRSRGGLRDLQLVRWVGFACYGQHEPKILEQGGHLCQQDYRGLRKAQDFLLRLRNELHFFAEAGCDNLSRSEQIRLSELYGFKGKEGLLPVEQFMQTYFSHTSTVREVVANFVDGARWRHPRLRRCAALLSSHRVEGDFRAGPVYISATRSGLHKVQRRLAEVLRLMDLASRYNCRIDHPTWQAIRSAMMSRDDWKVDREAAERFLSFLSHPNQLGRLLRRLHELRVLGKLIPGFEHVRCLLQFNEYHKYTVDEHSIQAVERATEFIQGDSILSQAYRGIKRKHIFHLALLVHDMGKGYAEDHSDLGSRLALKVAETLYLDERDTETLRFLVHRHLMLSHLAFRRDTSDESVVLEHSAEIGSPAMLRMMFVLTCADLAAVGPGVLNQWKQDVLTQLYVRMMDQLSGGISLTAPPRLEARRRELIEQTQNRPHAQWLRLLIESLPPAYLDGPSRATILEDLDKLHRLPRDQAIAWGRFLPERNAVEYTVGVYEDNLQGIFHRLTGAISSQGMEILAADIHSLADRLCLDRFYVQDNDFRGQPPEERLHSVSQALVKSLLDDSGKTPTFRRMWHRHVAPGRPRLTALPTKVKIDNTTSDLYSIVDVFTHDRPGLLYNIARTLFELNLSVATAKIGTYLDQVVDVFYVTEASGEKLQQEERINQVRSALLQAIDIAPCEH